MAQEKSQALDAMAARLPSVVFAFRGGGNIANCCRQESAWPVFFNSCMQFNCDVNPASEKVSRNCGSRQEVHHKAGANRNMERSHD